MFGAGAMTNSIDEIRDSELMFVIGSNTTEAHPIIAMEMKRARQKGAKPIVGSEENLACGHGRHSFAIETRNRRLAAFGNGPRDRF